MKTPWTTHQRKLKAAVSMAACVIFLSGCAGFSFSFSDCDDDDDSCSEPVKIEARTPPAPGTTTNSKDERKDIAKADDSGLVVGSTEKAAPYGALSPQMFDKITNSERTGYSASAPKPKVNSLGEVIRNALKTNPQIGIAIASQMESEAAVSAARAA